MVLDPGEEDSQPEIPISTSAIDLSEIIKKYDFLRTPLLLAEVETHWKKLSPLVTKAKGKWKEIRSVLSQTTDPTTFHQYEKQLEDVQIHLSQQFLTLEALTDQILASGEIPPLFPVEVPSLSDRSEGEEEILSQLPQLEQDLARMKQRAEEEIVTRLKAIPGLRLYNL